MRHFSEIADGKRIAEEIFAVLAYAWLVDKPGHDVEERPNKVADSENDYYNSHNSESIGHHYLSHDEVVVDARNVELLILVS